MNIVIFIPLFGILALVYTWWKTSWIKKQEVGTEKMEKISSHIAEGAMAFLRAEYKVLIIFVICVGILLALSADPSTSSPLIAVSFLTGAFCSALAGFIGMRVATKANVRKGLVLYSGYTAIYLELIKQVYQG
ncbi:MAG: sodium/proton-translocating pyrophosphatase [Ignavibacteriaceae bacterium]